MNDDLANISGTGKIRKLSENKGKTEKLCNFSRKKIYIRRGMQMRPTELRSAKSRQFEIYFFFS